jgi:hypothetical protein
VQDRDAPRYKGSMENVGRSDSSDSPLQYQGEHTFLGLPDPHPDPLIRGTYESEDPDPHPDPYQNVTVSKLLTRGNKIK